ncbi:MAG TPA: DedA family protein [Terriglobales bacterium]|nr:DedA family protein [Terriglobales bacterium]
MIEQFFALAFQFIRWVIDSTGYAGIVILMAIESACIPLPSELIMPFAGYLASEGRFNLWLAATAGAIGCNLGSVLAYEIGYYGGRPLVEKYGKYILLNKRDMEHAEKFFGRYGDVAIFVGRLLPVIRTFIALPAGVSKMPRGRFHLYTFIGSWPWCYGLAWIGQKMGERWMEIKPYFLQFKEVIAVLLVLAVVWFVWTHWKYRVRETVGTTAE